MGAITATCQPVRPVTPVALPPAQAAGAPVAPTNRDHFVRQASTSFEFPGLTTGKTYAMQGIYQGISFGGTAIVNCFDGKVLDLSVSGSAMMGLVKAQAHVRLEANSDGTVTFLGERTDQAQDAPTKAGARMKVLTNRPGLTVLEAPNGNQVKVAALPGGGLQVSYDQAQLTLQP